jgi:hypothetical protein
MMMMKMMILLYETKDVVLSLERERKYDLRFLQREAKNIIIISSNSSSMRDLGGA